MDDCALFRVRMVGEYDLPDRSVEVNCRMTVALAGDRATWTVDGEPMMESTTPEMVALARWMLGVFAGLAVAADPAVKDVFDRLVSAAV